MKFSFNKAFDLIGKFGLMLLTGGLGGLVFSHDLDPIVAGYTIASGVVCVIIGAFEVNKAPSQRED